MLGLVPDPAVNLNGQAVKRYRTNAGLKTSDLAARLAERGWPIGTKDVFAWETKSAAGLSPALIRAVAEVLGVEAEKVTLRREVSGQTVTDKVSRSQWFVDLCWSWAGKLEIPFGSAKTALLGHMSATANRGGDLTEEQWRDVLEQLPPHVPDQPPRR
jgi:transcriptional regulator with XRE-family HTH domain